MKYFKPPSYLSRDKQYCLHAKISQDITFVPGQFSLSWDSLFCLGTCLGTCPKTPVRHLQSLGQNDVPSATLGTEFCPKLLYKTQFVPGLVPGQINVSCNGCRPSQDTLQDILLCLVKVVIFLVLCLSRDKYDGGFNRQTLCNNISLYQGT